MNDLLKQGVATLPGTGAKTAQLLRQEFRIETIAELLSYYPHRYIDRSVFLKVNEIRNVSENVQLIVRLESTQIVGAGKKRRLETVFSDDTGRISAVWFRGISWIYKSLTLGREYVLFGKPNLFGGQLSLTHPEFEIHSPNTTKRLKMEPVYETSEKMKRSGLNSRGVMRLVRSALQLVGENLPDFIPEYIRTENHLPTNAWATKHVHFPNSEQEARLAIARIKFDELFSIQMELLQQKRFQTQFMGHKFATVGELFNRFYHEALPFSLTEAQKRVIREIRIDVNSGRQMNRLIQGDVGSGKTLVALFSMLLAADNDFQACMMAPTEILAQQHHASIGRLVKDLPIQVGLLTGSTTQSERRTLHARLRQGEIHILIGTHALIEEEVQFENLGLVVIDEQQRFGVDQRARLWGKSRELLPHILIMTATPIPRTLALTLYGDLDVSVIDELPPGRKPIKTMHAYDVNRPRVYEQMRGQIAQGRQVYVVYPLIKESETLDFESLEEGFETLQEFFPTPHYRLVMLHGKMTPEEKETAMGIFKRGEAHILVSTTVIEVGVDVPNATMMVIESAQRFGLSQLHQLRGRVGRGAAESYCILMTGVKLSHVSRQRIATMVRTNDGFEIAEADLALRGAGDLEGTQQSGMTVRLKLANLARDGKLLNFARRVAESVYSDDPDLTKPENSPLAQYLEKRAEEKSGYSKIG